MAKRPPTIPDSELDVLKVLWDLGQATVREAMETLRAAGRQWSYATVATLLDRLESKGLVTSDRRELAFVYRPAISTQEVRQRRLTSLVDKLYQGEPGLLVLHLLKSHPLDAEPGQGSPHRAGPDGRRESEEERTSNAAGQRTHRPPRRYARHHQFRVGFRNGDGTMAARSRDAHFRGDWSLVLVLAPAWKLVEPLFRPGPKMVSARGGHGGAASCSTIEWTPGDPWTSGDGLGPVFNATSCVECHNQGDPAEAGRSART